MNHALRVTEKIVVFIMAVRMKDIAALVPASNRYGWMIMSTSNAQKDKFDPIVNAIFKEVWMDMISQRTKGLKRSIERESPFRSE